MSKQEARAAHLLSTSRDLEGLQLSWTSMHFHQAGRWAPSQGGALPEEHQKVHSGLLQPSSRSWSEPCSSDFEHTGYRWKAQHRTAFRYQHAV
jgi:hypothetical protein